MNNQTITALLLSILLVQVISPVSAATPASIEISSSGLQVSSDGALQFDAVVKDSSGNQINELVTWSTDSGQISQDGLFTPGVAGLVNITALSGTVNSSMNITVIPGWPTVVVSNISNTSISIDEVVQLSAYLEDRAGNLVTGSVAWRSDDGSIDQINSTWTPSQVGNSTIRAIWSQIETQIQINVSAGVPISIELPLGMIAQSGSSLDIVPVVLDSHGNEVDISKAGILSWTVEDGSITQSGTYVGNSPGFWNISISSSSGANGSGMIRVLPAQATDLDIGIIQTTLRAGTPINLSAIRTDILGNEGIVPVSLNNWSVPTGSLSMGEDIAIWTPSRIGTWTIGVVDQGLSTTLEVEVIHGLITEVEIVIDSESLMSGESIVVSLIGLDGAGNPRAVSAAWTVDSQLEYESHGGWILIRPGEVGNYTISSTWFDNETAIVHEISKQIKVESGELARIILAQSGLQVPSDGILDLNPRFEDEFGNVLEPIQIDWLVDGEDRTMEIRIAEQKWAPSSLGLHEIRAMGAGVFAILEVEVVPGSARNILTNADDGLIIISGEETELTVSTVDVHGNSALATSVEFEFEDPIGEVIPSPKGAGYWTVLGGQTGQWNLRLIIGNTTSDLTLNVIPGPAIRLVAQIPEENPEEGSTFILRVHAIDQAGNRVEVPQSELTIACTVGPAAHITGDTYEVEVDQAGQFQSCNVLWDGLVAQKFFDVDAVLFGGGLGDTNSALTMVIIIVILVLAIMVVLMKRMNNSDSTENLWDDDEGVEDLESFDEPVKEVVAIHTPTPEPELEPKPVLVDETEKTDAMRDRLAAEAKRTGIMQAAPGTEQGKTGWYIDTSGELTSWEVSDSGEWSRLS
jgi:hypothetical protein